MIAITNRIDVPMIRLLRKNGASNLRDASYAHKNSRSAGGISRKGEINDQGNGGRPDSAQAGMPKNMLIAEVPASRSLATHPPVAAGGASRYRLAPWGALDAFKAPPQILFWHLNYVRTSALVDWGVVCRGKPACKKH